MRALYPQEPNPRKVLENKLRQEDNTRSHSLMQESPSFFQKISEDKVTDKLTFKEKFYNILQERVTKSSMRDSRDTVVLMTEPSTYSCINGRARFQRPNTTLEQFRDLSDQFDQLQSVKNNNVGQVEDIYKKFDLNKALLNELGVDQTKKQV